MQLRGAMLCAGACALLALSGCATVPPQTTLQTRAEQTAVYLANAYDLEGPGAAFIVTQGRETLASGAVGHADVEWGIPNDQDTVFRLGSISKSVTAIAVLDLVEQGVLDLDAPVSAYAPSLPTVIGDVTLRQLMSHRSGLAEHAFNPALLEFIWLPMTTDKVIELQADAPASFAPGERYEYVNFNYVVVAHVIEKATGQSFVDYINGDLFARHRISGAHYDEHDRIIPKRAEFYTEKDGALINAADIDMSHVSAAGALMSSARSLAEWAALLMSGDLVSNASLALAWTAEPLPNGAPTEYGLGFNVATMCGERVLWHTGLTPGAKAGYVIIPGQSLFTAVLSNAFHAPNPYVAMRDAASILLTGAPGNKWDEDDAAICTVIP